MDPVLLFGAGEMRAASERYRGFIDSCLSRAQDVRLMDMQGVARGPPPQASRRFLLKPPVDAFWNHPGEDQVEPPFGSIELTWPGRANRSTRSLGGRSHRRALEVWLCRCGSYASRVDNRSAELV
jgi:hypothetical protein